MARNRAHIHLPIHLGDKIADKVTEALGSWNFIIAQSFVLALWIVLNSVRWFYHWDGAPFILLNLCLSFQAAFTGPIVLLSQNRAAAKDRKRDDVEASEVEQLFSSHQLLLQINNQQLEILQLLRDGGSHEETKVRDDRQAQKRSDSTVGRSGKNEGWQASEANEVGVSLTSYLAQIPEHPLARGIEQWITSLGKTLDAVSWWKIYAGHLAPHTWKARVSVKFVGSPTKHDDVFVYSDLEFLKGIDNGPTEREAEEG